jgi:hypothetical protein
VSFSIGIQFVMFTGGEKEKERERLVCTLQCNPFSKLAIGEFHSGMTFTIDALLYVFK